METVCIMKEIFKAIRSFEDDFYVAHRISLNEAIVLCSLATEKLSSSGISERTGFTPSHTSKLIRTVEDKKLIERLLGKTDKRQMYFSLTTDGMKKLDNIKCGSVKVPDILKPVFQKVCPDSR